MEGGRSSGNISVGSEGRKDGQRHQNESRKSLRADLLEGLETFADSQHDREPLSHFPSHCAHKQRSADHSLPRPIRFDTAHKQAPPVIECSPTRQRHNVDVAMPSWKVSSFEIASGNGNAQLDSGVINRATSSCPITTRNHRSRSVITRYCRSSAVP